MVLQSADLIQFEEHPQECSGRMRCFGREVFLSGLKKIKARCLYGKSLTEVGRNRIFRHKNTYTDYSGPSFLVGLPAELDS